MLTEKVGRNLVIMSPEQYVKALNGSQRYKNKQAVNYRIRKGLPLYGVKEIKKILDNNILIVNRLCLVGLKTKK